MLKECKIVVRMIGFFDASIKILDRFLLQPGKVFLEKWSPCSFCLCAGAKRNVVLGSLKKYRVSPYSE